MKIRINDGRIELEAQALSIFNLKDELELYIDGQEKLKDTEIYYVSIQESFLGLNNLMNMN